MPATWIPAGESMSQTGLHNTNKGALAANGRTLSGVVRESVQNALDAKFRGATGPVLVDFKWTQISSADFPDKSSFLGILDKCGNACGKNDKKTIDRMKSILRNPFIDCLRIRDYNTIGLTGAENDAPGSNWHRLVREQGTGAQSTGRNGSHGVGKLAPFLVSGLRTVFYSSIDEQGFKSHVGVSRLCSYVQDDPGTENRPYTDGIYYFQNDEKTFKSEGRHSLTGLVPFEKQQLRADGETGTDVYVLGYSVPSGNALRMQVLRATLENFLFSIHEGVLSVDVPAQTGAADGIRLPTRLDAESLPEFVKELQNERKNANVREIRTMVALAESDWTEFDPEKHGKSDGFSAGDFKFKFVPSPGDPKCLVTRASYMALETIKCPGGKGVFGILTLVDPDKIELFRRMENANHTKFEVDEERFPDDGERQEAERLLSSLRTFVKEYVLREFATEKRDRVHAAIPPSLRDRFGHRTDTDIGEVSSVALKRKIEKTPPSGNRKSGPVIKPKNVGNGGPGGGGVNNPKPKDEKSKNTTGKSTKRRQGSTTEDGDKKGFSGVPFPIAPRIVQEGSSDSGLYRIVLTMPETAATVKVRFQSVGESGRDADGLLSLLEIANVARNGAPDPDSCIRTVDSTDKSSFMLEIKEPQEGDVIQFDGRFDVDFRVLFNILYSATKGKRA